MPGNRRSGSEDAMFIDLESSSGHDSQGLQRVPVTISGLLVGCITVISFEEGGKRVEGRPGRKKDVRGVSIVCLSVFNYNAVR